MKRQSLLGFLGSCASALVSADSIAMEHFEATCTDVRVEGYRYDIGLDRKVYSAWSKDDKFGSTWRIRFTGGKRAQVDDDLAVVLDENGPILILSTGASNDTASSVWLYAVHRDLKQIVAAQVNGFDGLMTGLKTRSVQLNCTFKELD